MASEKNALCKAMGTLLLQHRVQRLEDDVREMELKRSSGSKGQGARVSPTPSCSSPSSRCILSRTRQPKPQSSNAMQTIVVDASVLIYSMRSVHEWRKRSDVRVVVPDEAICTLDVLKKGDGMINVAARKAARYLEEHLECSAANSYLPGLRPQGEGQRLKAEDAVLLRLSQPADEDSSDGANDVAMDGAAADDAFELKRAPVNVRETLLGSLWYQQDEASKSNSAAMRVAIAFPPPEGDAGASPSAYAQRVDGREVLPWLKAYGFRERRGVDDELHSIEVAPTAGSWLQQGGAGDERGQAGRLPGSPAKRGGAGRTAAPAAVSSEEPSSHSRNDATAAQPVKSASTTLSRSEHVSTPTLPSEESADSDEEEIIVVANPRTSTRAQ